MRNTSKGLIAAAFSLALLGSSVGSAQAGNPNGGGDTVSGVLQQVATCVKAFKNNQSWWQANCRNDIVVNLPGSRGGGKMNCREYDPRGRQFAEYDECWD